MAKKKGNAAAIALLDKWLADESGYDEKVWGRIRDFLNEGAPDADYIALVKRAKAKVEAKIERLNQECLRHGTTTLHRDLLEREIVSLQWVLTEVLKP